MQAAVHSAPPPERRDVPLRLKPLHQQRIVITGGSSGIGLATARAAVAGGAAVLIAARNAEALDEIAADLRDGPGRIATCVADVAEPEQVERIAAEATEAFGGFDTWVNNAAAAVYGTLEQVSWADHRRVFDVDYFGLLKGSLVAAAHLRKSGGGAIINLGSILSDRAVMLQGPYCAAKHAVLAATDALRMELRRDGAPISVTLIKPSAIHTPYPEHARNDLSEPVRLPPILYAPELVAEAILFAATHPRRQLYVGGGGYLIGKLGQLFPRITDRAMEAFAVPMQLSPDEPGDPTLRDNLYEPRPDGDTEGAQPFRVRRQSFMLQAQKHPLGTATAGGAALLALALLQRGGSASAKRISRETSDDARTQVE